MVEKLVNKLVQRKDGEDVVNYIFRKQEVRNKITVFIEDVIGVFIITVILTVILLIGITRPIKGHWEPVYDENGVTINTVWVEH